MENKVICAMDKDTYFGSIKVNDRVWDFINGWGTVTCVDKEYYYSITVLFDCKRERSYTMEGKPYEDSAQSLFWDEIIYKRPPKPFNLEDLFLKYISNKWITPKQFKCNEYNVHFHYDYRRNELGYIVDKYSYTPNAKYFEFDKNVLDEIVAEANDNNVTFEDFKNYFCKIEEC